MHSLLARHMHAGIVLVRQAASHSEVREEMNDYPSDYQMKSTEQSTERKTFRVAVLVLSSYRRPAACNVHM